MAVQTIRRYGSIGEFLKRVEESPLDGACNKDRADWAGTTDVATAVRYAKHGGWEPEVASTFRDMFEEYIPRLRTYVAEELERTPDVCGGDINMQAYLDGEPEYMYDWVPVENTVQKRALCLLVGHSISASVTLEELFVKGQAIVGLVRALSLLGYELEIWSEQTVRGRADGLYTTLTRLHAAGEVLDTSAIEFAIGNPAWLRRLIFAAEECEPQSIREKFGFVKGGGYGGPVAPSHGDDVNADIVVHLNKSMPGVRTWDTPEEQAEAGFQWIIGQLRELGVIDNEEV